MKSLFVIASFAAVLFSWPAVAQQGPAGVPGLIDLVNELTSPTPTPAQKSDQNSQNGNNTVDCNKEGNAKQCQNQKQAKNACKDKNGKTLKKCTSRNKPKSNSKSNLNSISSPTPKSATANECSKSADTAQCVQFQKTKALCTSKTGDEHRQCLRDNLLAK